ncbi:MAG: M48 family metalloprotease [Candidatus Heimdallarchaeota archaeon]|nr:MAG: M48 family metalloprotease [Candidatus Heimdallarchaeota archaeon]
MIDEKTGEEKTSSTKENFVEEPTLVSDFDPTRRELTINYTRVSRRYGFILIIISFLVSVGVLLSRITIYLNELLIEFVSENPFIIVGIFFIIGFVIVSIVELPISFYLHSRLSRRYGLSKLTNRKWLQRYVKGEIIGFIIGFPLFEGFYWVLRISPENWWVWSTLIVTGFTLLFSFIIPIVLLPIFYKFDPLEETHPELAEELIEMTVKAGVKTTSAYNWRLGEIATVGNAGLLGLGATRRIIIADTMLNQYTKDEIKWILAHEIGHHQRHDLWKRILLGALSTFLIFLLTHIFFTPIAGIFEYPQAIEDISSIPVLGLCFWVISALFINVPSLWYSRRVEAKTDEFAMRIIPDFNIVKSLFIKMADQNLADINPPWWEKIFFMSHPSISERIRNAEMWANN